LYLKPTIGPLACQTPRLLFWQSAKAKWTTQIHFPYILDDVMLKDIILQVYLII